MFPLDVERASSAWCQTFLPSGRAGAGLGSRFRSPSHWSATMESSTPPPSHSLTPLNQGPGPTAALLGQFCAHIAPLPHHQHLHPHHPPHWVASQTAMGLMAAVTQACRQGHQTCRCCRSNTYSVRACACVHVCVCTLCVICMCVMEDWVRQCVHVLSKEDHGPVSKCKHTTGSESLRQTSTVIIRKAEEIWG